MSRLAAAALFGSGLLAQNQTATLHGVLRDVTGAAISGAAVTAKHDQLGEEKRTVTDPSGRYALLLRPGNYTIRAEAQGFRIAERRVSLAHGARVQLDIELQIGNVAETISVESSSSSGGHRRPRRTELKHNTEEYSRIAEDGFHAVRRRPLSTFSADVDTASYSNVRRFLSNGDMPPPDAVRIEEMLNYFRYKGYPEPEEGKPVGIKTEIAECPWNRNHMLALIGLRTRTIPVESLPPANLTFLIDTSGSMRPSNKLPLLIESFKMLAEQLRPQDRVAIVVYAGSAGLVLDSTPGSDKPKILRALDSLEAGGSTAGAAGIRLAYDVARKNLRKDGNNRLVLATDGDFNVGVSSEGELVRLIEEEREHGVFLTVLGFGYGNLKDNKMEKLADHGNGNYAYIDSIEEARKVLVKEMGGTLMTVAKDVKFQVEFNPAHVREWRLVGYENRRLEDDHFKDDKKDAGDLGAGHQVTALYELVPRDEAAVAGRVDALKYQPVPAKAERGRDRAFEMEAFTVKVRYKEPRGRKSAQMEHVARWSNSPMAGASEDLRFSAGIAEFAMLLRDSKHKGKSAYKSAEALVEGAIGEDPDGYRAEALSLIRSAARLARQRP